MDSMIWKRTREEVIVKTNFMSYFTANLTAPLLPPKKPPPQKYIGSIHNLKTNVDTPSIYSC